MTDLLLFNLLYGDRIGKQPKKHRVGIMMSRFGLKADSRSYVTNTFIYVKFTFLSGIRWRTGVQCRLFLSLSSTGSYLDVDHQCTFTNSTSPFRLPTKIIDGNWPKTLTEHSRPVPFDNCYIQVAEADARIGFSTTVTHTTTALVTIIHIQTIYQQLQLNCKNHTPN